MCVNVNCSALIVVYDNPKNDYKMKKIFLLILFTFGALLSCTQKETLNEENIPSREQTFDEKMAEFRKLAKDDIENDDVKHLSFGLPLPPKTEFEAKQFKEIDSIRKSYGIRIKNMGCTVSDESTALANEYHKITEVYLDKRNEEGWEEKMKSRIENIRAIKE